MNVFSEILTRFVIPDTIVFDNRTQFTAKEFRDFSKEFTISHAITAPFHPRFLNVKGRIENYNIKGVLSHLRTIKVNSSVIQLVE